MIPLRPLLPALPVCLLLLAGAAGPWSSRSLQALVCMAMVYALGASGARLARWLVPGFGRLSRMVAAFTLAVAVAVVPATLLGHFGVLSPGPVLLWVAVAFLASRWLPEPPEVQPDPGRPDPGGRAEAALILAAALAITVGGFERAAEIRYDPVGLGPDDESYHLSTVAVWQQHRDLRMIRFSMGDRSTPYYPVLAEVASWVLLAPFGDSDVLARWAQLPFAIFSMLATAAVGRRLGMSRRSAALAAILFASIPRVFPELALSAGNDHSASFFTLAALDGALALAAQPAVGVAVLTGLALGMLVGTKYLGLLYAATILGALVLAGIGRRLRSSSDGLARLGALVVLTAALAGGYTYLRNAVTVGNPVFPAPVRLFGAEIFPGWEAVTLAVRRHLPEFEIDVVELLLRREDLLGPLFPFTLLPAALAAPLVALGRRRFTAALVLALPAVFFCEFLWWLHDHRDMRYILPGVALAAVACAWLADQAGRLAVLLRAVLLLLVTGYAVSGKGNGAVSMLLLVGLGFLAAWSAPKIAAVLAGSPRRRGALVNAGAVALAAACVPLGNAVRRYQEVKLTRRPAAFALDRMVGPDGAAVAYVGFNKPYLFFGSHLQNNLQIVPWIRESEAQYYRWGGPAQDPYAPPPSFRRWQRNLRRLGVEYVVVQRSPWENPERKWITRRPEELERVYEDRETEIWRVLPEGARGDRR